ncbi:MAG: type III pantothenate kinase [Firmicutes bacterium]|nr:type III pantothenate kinase [Bacillota bacterium]
MLLGMNINNTHTLIGVFAGEKLLANWRLATDRLRTPDEYGLIVTNLLSMAGLDPKAVDGLIIASVVPPVTATFVEMCQRYFGREPMQVGPGTKTGLPIRYENPREVGADRVVNAVAGVKLYGPPLILVDLGTATTFCAISPQGEYLGGAIAPGLMIAAEALYTRTAKLPRIERTRPKTAIGRNTIASMQSGIVFGYAALVDGMVRRFAAEMGCKPKVIATGGLAWMMTDAETIDLVDPHLTLKGLRIIYEMNRESD